VKIILLQKCKNNNNNNNTAFFHFILFYFNSKYGRKQNMNKFIKLLFLIYINNK